MTWPGSTAGSEPAAGQHPAAPRRGHMNAKGRPPAPEGHGASASTPSQRYHLARYAEIGMALSGGEDISRLLEMIVHEAREITNADAGTLYMLNDERTHLDFVIMQNETMDVFLGGVEGGWISMPPVPLFAKDEQGRRVENHAHVSAHVANSVEIVNIPDVYSCKDFDFSGTRTYDGQTGYRSRSMLVLPLLNHEQDVIGVLQLLNAKDPCSGEFTAFNHDQVPLVAALASQAAVTLTRTRLIQGLTEFLEAFVQSIATAIEEKSRSTGGHIARVSKLATMIAERINHEENGPFKDIHFSAHELEELRLAGWMHDIGKIITPEYVVDKSRKLETIWDRGQLVAARFDLAASCLEAEHLRAVLALEGADVPRRRLLEQELQAQLDGLARDREFVLGCNLPGAPLGEQEQARLREIGARTFVFQGEKRRFLEEGELENLLIPSGTLNSAERKVMEDHAGLTWRMLSGLPFPKHLRRVPEFAAQHHEKLDGSGYPFGLTSEGLSLQSRIMVVADIFEALTARDRPYKEPLPLSRAVAILGELKSAGLIDSQVHDLLVHSGLIGLYALEELHPDQVDVTYATEDLPHGSDVSWRRMEEAQAAAPPDVRRERPLLLVVDDSESSRMLLRYYLKDAPWEVAFASDGVSGLTALARQCHDVVLLDLELEGMDGYELARRIREWEARHGLRPRPVLAMAAPFLLHSAARIRGSGCTASLTRPFGKDALQGFVSGHLA